MSSYIASNQYRWERLHPDIKSRAEGIFRQGNYSDAILVSFKQVEVRLKTVCGLVDDKIEIKALLGRAFSEKSGKLKYTKEERESLIVLFQGTMGLYRNPNGHKNVHVNSQDAFYQITVASSLLKEIDARKL